MKYLLSHFLACVTTLLLTIPTLAQLNNNDAKTNVVFETPGTGTWTVPCGVTQIRVEAWGAGGAGGDANTDGKSGGGGAGGAYAFREIMVTPGQEITYSVGRGGKWINNNADLHGGDTYFLNSSELMAKGGKGVPADTNIGGIAPNSSESRGTIVFKGGNGANAVNFAGGGGASAGRNGPGGNGGISGNQQQPGTSPLGGGGGNGGKGRRDGNGKGEDGFFPGGGGGGSHRAITSNQKGGSGANGRIIISYATTNLKSYTDKTFNTIEPITYVNFAGINKQSSNTDETPAPLALEKFCDTATVHQGETYSFTLKGNTNGIATNNIRVYIDWDQNGTFGNIPDEIYDVGTLPNSDGNDAISLSANITIPLGAKMGLTKMRVVKARSLATPAGNSDGGQAEEYIVNVRPMNVCQSPLVGTATNIAHTTATLNWVRQFNNIASNFTVEWAENVSFSNPQTATVNGNLSYTIEELTTNQTYYYRVKSECDSIWSETSSFTTGFYTPISVSGFNHDVIANGVGTGMETATIGIDRLHTVLIEKGAIINRNPAAEKGMPQNRVITSTGGALPTGLTYFLQNYSSNNSLRLNNSTPKTLTLDKPMAFKELYIAATSGQSASNLTIEVIYEDEQNSKTFSSQVVKDWFDGSPYIYASGSRIIRMATLIEFYTNDNPRIYQNTLTGLDTNRKVKAIRFTNTNGSDISNIANIFAVSGLNACGEVLLESSEEAFCEGNSLRLSANSSDDASYKFTWAPVTGLFVDEDMTTPYIGDNRSEVFASPDGPDSYSVTATSDYQSCVVTKQITLERLDTQWLGASTDWATASNWSKGTEPTIENCVRIPSNGTSPLIASGTHALAKNIIIEENANLEIQENASLTLNDKLINNAGADNFIMESGASLVQLNDEIQNEGEITFKRNFIFSSARKQYNFIISPVIDQKIKEIYPGSPAIIKYNENTNYFISGGLGEYIPGLGYGIKEAKASVVPASNIDAILKGIPQTGNVNIALAYTTNNPTAGGEHGYNLVGNPYPSNIDIIKLYNDNNSKIESTFHFWDNRGHPNIPQQGSSYSGANYATYNTLANMGVGAGSAGFGTPLDRIPTRFIRPSTAFIIQATPGSNNALLEFNNSQRIAKNDGPEFFGKDGSKNTARYWLTLQTPAGMEYMTAVTYFWNGKNEFGADDSVSNFSSDDIYTFAEEHQVAINGRSVFEKEDIVPLGVRLFDMGTYTISIFQQEGVFANGQNIYLKDKKLNIVHNLSQSDYSFSNEAGEFNNRFELIYKPFVFEASQEVLFAENVIQIELIDKNIVANSTKDKITKLTMYDLNQRPIYQNSNVNSLEFKLNFKPYSNKIVIVQIETESGQVVSKKFI